MKLNEILQDSYEYHWVNDKVAAFYSANKKRLEVIFRLYLRKDIMTAEVAFGILDKNNLLDFALSNDRDHLMILSTVIKIIKEYVSKRNVDRLTFSAKEPNRVKVYELIAKRLAKDFHLSIFDNPINNGETKFMLSKSPITESSNNPVSLKSQIAQIAQKVYDDWDENDDVYAGGGICDLIADEIVSFLSSNNVESFSYNPHQGENHVYVIAKFPSGIFEIDIPPNVYEIGGGYSWKKIPNIKFDSRCVIINKISNDIEKFDELQEY